MYKKSTLGSSGSSVPYIGCMVPKGLFASTCSDAVYCCRFHQQWCMLPEDGSCAEKFRSELVINT